MGNGLLASGAASTELDVLAPSLSLTPGRRRNRRARAQRAAGKRREKERRNAACAYAQSLNFIVLFTFIGKVALRE